MFFMLFYCCSQLSPLCLLSPPRRRCAVHCHRCRCLARPPLLPSRCRCAVHCRRRHVAVAPSIAVAVAPTITSITAAGAIVPSIAAVTVALPSLSHFPLLLPLRQPSSPLLCCHHLLGLYNILDRYSRYLLKKSSIDGIRYLDYL